MAKQIISLGATNNGQTTTYTVLFWFPITSGQRPQPSGSVWSGASAAENTAIQNGNVLEVQQSFTFPNGLAIANVKASLQQTWTQINALLAGIGPNTTFGVYYDPTTGGWSA
jgi:hypothetical protein